MLQKIQVIFLLTFSTLLITIDSKEEPENP